MLHDRYEPLSARATNADRTWLAAIDRGLRPRPEHRPQTVAAWRALMEANDDPAGTDAVPVATGRFVEEQTAEDEKEAAAGEPTGPDSARRDASPLEFEHFSRLTGRWIAYGAAHAVPIDEDTTFSSYDGYVDLIEAYYIEMGEREDAESSLPEQEESLLMTFYSMYSALQCGDYGFDRIVNYGITRC